MLLDIDLNIDDILADDILMAAIEADDAANHNVYRYGEADDNYEC